jgi:hypothetical protein
MSDEITSIAAFVAAKSDQINADDLIAGPVVVQLGRARRYQDDKGEERIEFATVGGKIWRPCKTMVRLLGSAWGDDPRPYVGRWVRLYRDPTVGYGGVETGGVRVSALSHLDRPFKIALTEKRGKKKMYTIDPLRPPTEKAPTAAPSLSDVLSGAGLTVQDLDAWRAGQNKPPAADLNDAQRAQLAGWLMADPARLDALRPTPEPTPDTAPGWEE